MLPSEVLRLASTFLAGLNVLIVLALAAGALAVCFVQPRRARHRARRRPLVVPATDVARSPVDTGPADPAIAADLAAVRADDEWLDDPFNGPGRDPELEAAIAVWAATCRLDPARWDKKLIELDGGA